MSRGRRKPLRTIRDPFVVAVPGGEPELADLVVRA